MPILYDLHSHTSFSADSEAPMETMILEAAAKGLKGICFTEHLDADFPVEDGAFPLDTPAYHARLMELKEKYKDKIEVLFGIELGMQAHLGPFYKELTCAWPFDYVIASQHIMYGRDPYFPVFWESHTDEEAVYRDYFKELFLDLQKMEDFDTCAHLDYIVRYGPNKNRFYTYEKYRDVIDPILSWLISEDKCLELNTSRLIRDFGAPNPAPEVLAAYYEMGGRNIVIGSDAHDPAGIAAGFDRAADILRDIGFDHYCVYRQRQRYEVALS